MKLLSLAALIGAFGCFTFPAPATAQNSCGQRDQVLERLGTQYGESRQSIGLAPNNGVVELFASTETGTWTLLMTHPNGVSCLIASGQAFETTAEVAQAKGDDA
ncbi:hypothetical protein [Celeribacter baekdonensis]|uniref:Uncharacterized protein n=1 Tax=Celeribacter baekdonensis TaxID=875171 RepID=A0A2R4M4H5_9RHOB|nr:hypothetical protein [Celeribacter baekdonensis]AVW92075.1 hypothetical protein DA792_14120 [Celeribacter baekdonensis]